MTGDPTPILVVVGLALMPFLWVALAYNRLVKGVNHCMESWSNVDTELKRRYELIPNLVEVAKGYAAFERDTILKVVEARNRALASTGSPAVQAKDENMLVDTLRRFLVVAEAYPDLKANAQFLALQEELANTEDRIQAARRFYNANVRDLNNSIETFPSLIIAKLFGFSRGEFFEIGEASHRAAPVVPPIRVTA